jgi:hypothetical protein
MLEGEGRLDCREASKEPTDHGVDWSAICCFFDNSFLTDHGVDCTG